MFYAVLALAASKDVVVSKHTHAIAFLDKEFIKKGIFRKKSHAHFMSVSMNDKPTITGNFGHIMPPVTNCASRRVKRRNLGP
jgi:uncharacterized protein (UPF0332 family)